MRESPEDKRVFGYHAQITWGQWIIFGYFGFLSLMAMFGAFKLWQQAGATSPEFMWSILNALFYALLAGGFFALYRALATFKLVVDQEGFSYSNFRAEGYLRWEDIRSVRGRYIPYLGGWLTVKSRQTTLRMTVVLKDIDAFTTILQRQLCALQDPPFRRENLYGFLKTAAYSSMSFYRLKTGWWRLLLVWLMAIALAVVMLGAQPAPLSFYNTLVIFMVLGVVLPGVLFAAFDITSSRRWILDNADEAGFEVAAPTPAVHAKIWEETMRGMLGGALLSNALVWGMLALNIL